jgi:hypothetical protein
MKKPRNLKAVAVFCLVSIPATLIGLYCLTRLLDSDLAAYRRIKAGMTEADVQQVLDEEFVLWRVLTPGRGGRVWKTWANNTCDVTVAFEGDRVVSANLYRHNDWSLAEWLNSHWPW